MGWLVAAAAPILIHLWMRHTYREMTWAAMQFLQAAIKRQARRLRLQQWLLLALRTLILVLVALAAAKPFLSDLGWIGGGMRVHRVLVVDTSLSMSAVDAQESRFARALSLANELIGASRPGESFSLVTLADPPQVRLTGPVSDKSRVAAELTQLETTYGTADLPATLALVRQVMADADDRGEPLDRHEVICFTDLAQNTWRAMADAGESGLAVAPDESSELLIVDVGAGDAANLSVADLQFADKFPTSGRNLSVSATIANHAAQPAEDVVVALEVDGTVAEERTVSVDAGGTARVTFERTFAEDGWHQLELRLPGDALRGDDSYYLSAKLPSAVEVLCVEGRSDAARYLASALDPAGSRNGPLKPVTISAGRLRDTPLGNYRCVLLSNVPQLTASELKQLAAYVRHGGGLALFMGDAVDVDSYNTARHIGQPASSLLLTALLAADGETANSALLPVRIKAPVSQSTFGIDPLDYAHPIARSFQGREQAGLLTTPIARHCPLEPLPDRPDAKVALALSDGSPLLVTCPFGNGMVAVCGTAATLDSIDPATGQPWTLWPAWPSFLPVVRETVRYIDAAGADMLPVTIAAEANGRSSSPTSGPLVVIRPDEREDTIVATNDMAWEYDGVDVPGFYVVTQPDGGAVAGRFAANTALDESNLQPVAAAELPEGVRVVSGWSGDSSIVGNLGSTAWLYRYLLYAVLVLMVVESIIANRWGRASR